MPRAGGRDLFDAIDKTNQGYINKQDLFRAYCDGILVFPNGTDVQDVINGGELNQIYQMIDPIGKGYITKQDFRQFRRDIAIAKEKERLMANDVSSTCYQM